MPVLGLGWLRTNRGRNLVGVLPRLVIGQLLRFISYSRGAALSSVGLESLRAARLLGASVRRLFSR